MTLAIVSLCAVFLAAVGGVVLLAVRLSAAKDAVQAAERNQTTAEKQRDVAIENLAAVTAERDAAIVQLTATQAAANVQTAKEIDHVRDSIAAADPADVGRLFDEQLSQLMPGARTAGVATANGAGHASAAAVQPAGSARPDAGDAARKG